jgi:ribonuclease D
MDSTSPTPLMWIDTPTALRAMMKVLRKQSLVAVDTESNSLYAYQEQVCLVQFSTPENDYLVDPLKLKELSALGEIFASPKIEKIFHAAEYDIICLKRDFGFTFENIFDTMLASRILGKPEIGLGSILKLEFGISLEKRFQRANWGERPLSIAMLDYARQDTHYLIELRDKLREELLVKGLFELAMEDFSRLTETPIPETENDNQTCWKLIGRNQLTNQQCAVLQSLLDYRDRQARRANQPHFKILGNITLLEIAKACPTTEADLIKATHLSPRQQERHLSGLLQAVSQGMTSRPPARPVNHRPDDVVIARIERLKNWRKSTARKLKVESDVVLPRDILDQLAYKNPTSLDELKVLMRQVPWRFTQYGTQIIKVVSNQETQ